ncbi:dihydrolipoyl dehydrogenase [Actinomadura atramentaria]|uniref:dihydrolipoyl dehydrogenase n=1 Tax=Actinomadura atramentaria TaxID=1990 RepID=UPI00037BD866|nr:dihydrolipoyl dehydrogenase [Actinomadura atramentaria]
MADGAYDIVVLGGGSGGYACALRAAELGRTVALVERDALGGTCLNRGCIPTKALLHAAEVADQTREAAAVGVRAVFEGVDIDAVHAYKDRVVATTVKGLTGLIRSRGIEIVPGTGRLTGPTTVAVSGPDGERTLTGRHVVLATGSEPRAVPGVEVDGERIITSDHALRLGKVPASVIVLGGGVIGVEFASVWRSFGADVTIVEALPHLLPLEEESSSARLERAFRRRGIAFRTGARLSEVRPTPGGVSAVLADGSAIDAELMLVAVGRAPVTDGLGLDAAGVATERGFVVVDGHCRTSVPTISAVGDLVATPQLAHVGFAEGILVAERLGGLDPRPIDYDGVPRITYSAPEVASVGLTTRAARERGYEVDEVAYDLAGNPRSKILGTQGEVKVIAAVGGPVLGVHMVGARVGELIAEGQLIYNWEALPGEVASLIHPHPTQSEAVGEAHLALAGKPLHVRG